MAVRVCPSVSVTTHMTSVSVHQFTYQHIGSWTPHAGPSSGLFGTHRTSVCVRQHTQDIRGCSWLSVSTHKMSVAVRVCPCVSVGVRQHTQDRQDVHLCLSAHTGRPCVSACVRRHTGRPWLSISTHISTLFLGLSTLALSVDSLGDFGPRGLSVQYTHDVRWCPSAHTGRPNWTSVAVCVCPCVSISTHRTSVAVHQYTYQHFCPWTQHPGPSHGLFGTQRTSVGVHQHTQDVHGCSWLSVSTHRTSVATHDICGCLRVSVCVRQHTHDVRVCPSVHISARWSLDSAHWPFPWTVRVILAHVGCLVSTHKTSVAVRVCPSVSVSTHRTSVSIHQFTYQHVGLWTPHDGPSRGLFG
ncbi:unnamed protein product [Brassica rapa]|uniref:Uncharacterized protein n=1 Tax=Brassica campestris TaxID=3711 RepID=A0A8D9DHE9_BRACM|nr:unnamed protein product [Brassica rapa]